MASFDEILGFEVPPEAAEEIELAEKKSLEEQIEELKKRIKEEKDEEERKKMEEKLKELEAKLAEFAQKNASKKYPYPYSYKKPEEGSYPHPYPYKKYPYPYPYKKDRVKKGTMEGSPTGVVVYLQDGEDFKKEGRYYRKEILYVGKFPHPQAPMATLEVTSERLDKFINNTKAVGRKVPVTLNHPEGKIDPLTGVGYVFAFERKGNSCYALLEILDPEVAAAIDSGKIQDVSVGIRLVSYDNEGNFYDGVFDHVALTLKPSITDLKPFEKLQTKAEIFDGQPVGICFSISKGGGEKMETLNSGQSDALERFEAALRERDSMIETLRKDLAVLSQKNAELLEAREESIRKERIQGLRKMLEEKAVAPRSKDALIKFAEELIKKDADLYAAFEKTVAEIQMGDLTEILKEASRSQQAESNMHPATPAEINEIANLSTEEYAKLREKGAIDISTGITFLRNDWKKLL